MSSTSNAFKPSFRHANAAPRCQHVRLNGAACGCPANRGSSFCHFHQASRAARAADLPLLEDAASIQLALMRIIRALQQKTYDTRTCGLMLYALQIASSNLRRLADELPRDPATEPEHPALALLRELEVLPRDQDEDNAPAPDEPAALETRNLKLETAKSAAGRDLRVGPFPPATPAGPRAQRSL